MRIPGIKHAILPESLEDATIDTMSTDETAYVVPWAMWVDAERHCWLHPKYTTHRRPGGTVQMRVEKREDGYYVWTVPDHRYTPQHEPGYVSPEDTEYIPVVALNAI